MLRSLRVGLCSLLAASTVLPACSYEPKKKEGADRADPRGDAGDAPGRPGGPDGAGGPRPCPANFSALDECDSLKVPLDWAEPGGETISVFYGKKRAKGEAKAQLWLLQGGPGGSGEVFSLGGDVDRLHDALPDVDVYVLEHRGVGESTRLGCDRQEAEGSEAGADVSDGELGGCIEALRDQWGDGLRHFSSQAAALDLGAATDATRAPGRKLFVYGVSYGTYWAIQYLKARPADADGVILDSVATPGVQLFTDFGLQFDPVAERLASFCSADAVCREKMGDDPYAAALAIMARVDAGHCFGDEAPPGAVRSLLAQVLQIGGANVLVFPLLYRLDRCDPADRAALESFFSLLVGDPSESAAGAGPESFAVRMNIGFSEFWSDSPTRAEYDARCAETAFCTPGDFDRSEVWPRYAPPADVYELPSTEVPVLALNGDLDPQTPIEKAERVKPMLRNGAQTFVRVPFSTHFVVGNSPVRAPDEPTCGFRLMTNFVEAPGAAPDLSCLEDLLPPSFDVSPDFAERLFGTSDVWENEPSGGDDDEFAPKRAARLDMKRLPSRPRHDLAAALRVR